MLGAWDHWRQTVRILCALALVLVAFAHKPVAIADPAPIDLAAYALPDGTLPTLCLTDQGSDDDHKSSWHGTGCEACRLSASFILPVPPKANDPSVVPLPSLNVKREAALIARSAYPPAAPPHAPPFA
ncbi:hypothetical protein M8997_007415 [Phyllobacterium sp. 21LDTY02-6]|uniref:hypothetical protein n=1 Tax=Phyllobacterium sp. 21LDTY02-6 TaxID=2944903 RepID=UPI002021A524|nr:hypothetical protein [Phyllobacterium sp. 21LDTY02-6]MCO4317007.1 hypothetical protein [Phyllobacterium sp. 21LDTY02-6]